MMQETELLNNKKPLKNYESILFFAILFIVYFFIDFQEILFMQPQGIHFIRQTDSLSFISHYIKNGMRFFEPGVLNLQSTDGKAACEFPLIYYFTALSYKIFGEHEFFLRLITLSIVSIGFFHLFKLLQLLTLDLFYSLIFSFLFLSSTVLLYYSNNFLPDASALGFTLIGWYFFYSFLQNRNKIKPLITSFLFFTLGSLLKVTYFINPITALLTVITYDILNKTNLKKKFSLIIVFSVSLLLVISWNLYAIWYNGVNNDHYFLVTSRPLWKLSRTEISEIRGYITGYWYSRYYSVDMFNFIFILIFAGFIFIKKANKLLLISTVFLFAGSLSFFILFYAQFKDHDYYFITLIPAIIFITINSFIALKNRFPKVLNSYIAKLILLIICLVSLNYAKIKVAERYDGRPDKFADIGLTLSGARNQIDSLGISRNSKFIIFTDKTPNGGLYFIDRPGWNIPDGSKKDIKNLTKYILNKADYLLCTDDKYPAINNRYELIYRTSKFTLYKIK